MGLSPGPHSELLLKKGKRDHRYPARGKHGLLQKGFDIVQATCQSNVETEGAFLRQAIYPFI